MNITRELLVKFGRACTRNDAGQHFTKWLDYAPLEKLGLIKIHRPIHYPSGITYSQEHWLLKTTPLAETLADLIYDSEGLLRPDAVAIATGHISIR